jgi:hypothetical protein
MIQEVVVMVNDYYELVHWSDLRPDGFDRREKLMPALLRVSTDDY